MNARHLFAAALLICPVFPLSAQNAGGDPKTKGVSEDENNRRFWQADLPGGAYVIALDRISSVGKHEYLVDGGYVVTEVTIDTVGSVVARFYYGEPFRPDLPGATGEVVKNRMEDVIETVKERTGANQTDRLVVKNYPTSTHAHTVEFRITNKQNLDALFQSVNRSWMTGRGVRFTIRNE